MTTNSIIRFENVSKSYSDGTVVLKISIWSLKKGNFIHCLVHQVVVKQPFYELLQDLRNLQQEIYFSMIKD